MSLFKKNPNEVAFNGGKKHWTDVIKNTSTENFLIWRQPEEDFNTNSTLIVMPGEEAIFVNEGTIEQVFTNGTYKLNTNNYPFISRLRNSFSGGISTFNCVVYFVNKTVSMEIYWGTDSPIQVRDPAFQIACDLQARGSYKVRVEDSSKFLIKLFGNSKYLMQYDELVDYFRSQFLMHIKSNLVKVIQNEKEELIGINAKQEIIASNLSQIIENIFADYGLHLQVFSIESIDVVDNENRRKLENAISDKNVMGILGDNWERQKRFELMSDAANNEGSGSIAGAGIGVGLGLGMGKSFGEMTSDMVNTKGNCVDQKASVSDPLNSVNNLDQKSEFEKDPVEMMKKLKEMLDLGLITKEQYDKKSNEIISNM